MIADAPTSPPSRRRGLRVLAIYLGLIAVALAWLWFFHDIQRQDQWVRTVILLFAAFAGFLVWVLFGSKWPARVRWAVFVGMVAVLVFCRFGLRITGVTGDLFPIVEGRWNQPRVVVIPPSSPTNDAAGLQLTNRYPQFLGPTRDGVLPGPRLARDWKRTPPVELWRHGVGAAWSGFAVEGARAITQEQRGEEELVVCYDLLTGREVWSHADKSRYATTIAGEGPRATPAISDQHVYAIGGAGVLNCLELGTGKVIWTTNVLAQHGAKVPDWGVAGSPLVTEKAVIVVVGGAGHTLVAYDKRTGARLWTAGNDNAHWSSPVRLSFLDQPAQIVTFNETVAGHDERTGKLLWQHPWRGGHPHVAAPLAVGTDSLLVSSGYGTGSELLQLTFRDNRWRTQRVWKSIRLKSKFANILQHRGFLYGLDDGALVCVELATGELRWKGDRYGHGQMILVGDVILLTAENGDIVLVEPDAREQREVARFKVFSAKTWNPPALAGDLLVVRNDREAVCLRLPVMR